MKRVLENYTLSDDQFEKMPIMQQREYILQKEHSSLIEWQKFVAVFQSVGIVVGLVIGVLAILSILGK